MKYGGQNDEATFRNHYMPNNPGTDGQSSYLGGELRSIVNDLFRGMSLSRNPDLWQSLPAEKRVELETRPEFSALNKELEDLNGKAGSTERERRRLYAQKQRLITKELRQCQNDQPCKAPSGEAEETHLMGHHRARFARVSRLMPERQRLASNMFLVASLRSAEGRSVLHDMIALCRQETEVVSRPGLEADKCRCLMADHDRKPDRFVTLHSLPSMKENRLLGFLSFITANRLRRDGSTYTRATRGASRKYMALPSCASCATNGSSVKSNGGSTAKPISIIPNRFPSSVTPSSTVERLPLLVTALSVWEIRIYRPAGGCINSSNEISGKNM